MTIEERMRVIESLARDLEKQVKKFREEIDLAIYHPQPWGLTNSEYDSTTISSKDSEGGQGKE